MKKIKYYLLAAIAALLLANFAYALDNEDSDPIVTQSYVEMRLDQLKTFFEEKLSGTQPETSSTGSASNSFKPVNVPAGKKLIGAGGTEIVLRAGSCKAIASKDGGLLDVTAGLDIQNNKEIVKNHLLVVPRDDGRGVTITGDYEGVFMIRGSYEIK